MAKETKEDSKNAKGAITSALSKKSGGFDLENFKKSKNLTEGIKFKKQEWIPLSDAFQNAISLPGIPHGHVVMFRGHSDTGKTSAMLEVAVSAQRMGKLPVFIVTEMKWSWEHAKIMGFDVQESVDTETGEIYYGGNFIYVDRDHVSTIEDVATFIADLLEEQKKGKLPFDLVFLWDSVGSIPCKMSVESNKNNNEWAAGAYSTQFGNFINQAIVRSRKETSQYTNSLIIVNKVWVEKPSVPMEMPKLKNKGGNTFFFDSSIVVTFGNVTNSGTSKIKATKDGKDVEFAKRTKISVDKNHLTGVTTSGRIVATPHGFIPDTPNEVDKYKKAHRHEWLQILGSDDFDVVEEDDMKENINDVVNESDTIE
jgi:RecA/RadA recombinase